MVAVLGTRCWLLLACCAMLSAQPRPILDTAYRNPAFSPKSAAWARDVCGGQRYLSNDFPPFEWMQVLDPASEFDIQIVGVSGTVVMPALAENDVPFTHPFGLDWEFFLAPDQRYAGLLAPGNRGPDTEIIEATGRAGHLGLAESEGVLGIETDQDLAPAAFRAQEGDRAVVFGRWIADCGHTDFHTEIHPPLLMAFARPVRGATTVTVVSRPWLVGQRFAVDDEPIRRHLTNEIIKLETLRSARVEAHPKIYPPLSGSQRIEFTARPPGPRRSAADRLVVSFHFTVRHGIDVEVIEASPDAVAVLLTMNPAQYRTAPLPAKKDWNIPVALISRHTDLFGKVQLVNLLGHPVAGLLLNRDWLTDRYDAPAPPSTNDSEKVAIDDEQPFPISGFLRVEWQR